MSEATPYSPCCKSEDIAAYLDGELDFASRALFEQHAKDCELCAAELREQRSLLCELDFALNDDPALCLPQNFAQVVAVQAQSDMSGMRGRAEHGRALRLSLALAIISFALVGATLGWSVMRPARLLARQAAGFFGFLGHAIYDAGAGFALISRAVGGHLIFESHIPGLLALLLLAVAVTLLPRLIVSYHRARTIE